MTSFKQFLTEGGHATSKHNIQRATPTDVTAALDFISHALGIPLATLKSDIIGSAKLTLIGKKKDSGDVDIALHIEKHDPTATNAKMLKAGGKGGYNAGSKVGSYAVPVGSGAGDRRIQVDLMFVTNKDWAKWMYHSAEGHGSKYPGAVRNIILFTALAHVQELGKDFVLRDEKGKAIVRASKSIRMGSGMLRLFKMAKFDLKKDKYAKSIDTVDPKTIEAHLREIAKKIKFSHDSEVNNNPDHVASFIFGENVRARDLMTAEDIIKQVHKMKNSTAVILACRSELRRLKLPIPVEL